MAERLSGLILLGLVLWTGLGVVGLLIARSRGEGARFRRGAWTLGAVWVGYAAVLVGVSLAQPGRRYLPGQERCFRTMCFAVEGTEEVEGFRANGQERERLLRVLVRVTNRGDATDREPGLAVYLQDAQGRRWVPLVGLGGVSLSGPVSPRRSSVSAPVFRLAKDATELTLVLHHEGWTSARLKIGDPEGILHRPATMALGPEKK